MASLPFRIATQLQDCPAKQPASVANYPLVDIEMRRVQMGGASAAVGRSDPYQTTGNLRLVTSEILAPKTRFHFANALFPDDHFRHRTQQTIGFRAVVDRRDTDAGHKFNLYTQRIPDRDGKIGQLFENAISYPRIETAQRSFDLNIGWNHIGRMSACDLAEGQDGRAARVGHSRYRAVGGVDELSGSENRVGRFMRPSSVPAGPMKLNQNLITTGRLRSIPKSETANFASRVDMQSKDPVDSLQRAGGNRLRRALGHFFGRLKNRSHVQSICHAVV